MSKLLLYLPPFAADYSGAAAVLFPFDCMVLILDAGCCTRSYAEYDEPRWREKRKTSFSAQLRTINTVMGDEAAIVRQIIKEARVLEPQSIALLGTPVPSVIGMDVAGIAQDIEEEIGIPCFSISTNGFDTYEQGISKTLVALIGKFLLGHSARNEKLHNPRTEDGIVANLLGVTPLDLPDLKALETWKDNLRQQGISVAFDGLSTFGINDIAAFPLVDVNIVLSWSGLTAARILERDYGIPFVCGVPFSQESTQTLCRRVRLSLEGARLLREGTSMLQEGAQDSADASFEDNPDVLLVGEQVFMNGLRESLMCKTDDKPALHVTVASFFALDKEIAQKDDFYIPEDADLDAFLRQHPGLVVAGDPLFQQLPSLDNELFIPINHPAVSGQYPADTTLNEQEIVNEIRIRTGA